MSDPQLPEADGVVVRKNRRLRAPSDVVLKWSALIGSVAGVGSLIVALCEAL